MGKLQRIGRLLMSGLLAIGLVLLATRIPHETWVVIGRGAALAAVSLQQADSTAEHLTARLERIPAYNAGESVTLPTNIAPPGGAQQQPMAEPTAPTADTAPVIPEEDGTGGKVVEQTVGGGSTVSGLSIKNKSGVAVDVAKALAADLPFSVEIGSKEPQVLIYHTHTTEGYMPYDAGYYNDGDIRREPSYPNNVTAVGDALEAELTAAGIAVIHDTTIHDYPAYRGAYDRSLETVQAILKQYPSIKVTLDLHRDGLMANNTDKLKPTVTVNGQKAAQMMVVCGVLSTEALPHPHWNQNLIFAAKLQQSLTTAHSALARPLSLTGARYNQFMTTGSLLIEMGSEGNTLEEAAYSARLLGQSLVTLFKESS